KVEKIVIDGPRNGNLTIRTEEDDKIGFSGNVDITSDSKEKANELSKEEFIITNTSDNILYISFRDTSDHNRDSNQVRPYNLNLTLPNNKEVEINNGYGLELIGDNIKNNWVIDKIDEIKIRLGKDSDVKINALVHNEEVLKGTAKWDIIKGNETEEESVKGRLIRGKGSNSINILNSSGVTVDELY